MPCLRGCRLSFYGAPTQSTGPQALPGHKSGPCGKPRRSVSRRCSLSQEEGVCPSCELENQETVMDFRLAPTLNILVAAVMVFPRGTPGPGSEDIPTRVRARYEQGRSL